MMEGIDLKDKVTVVTGGGSGIGRAISMKFASQGAIVHILELDAANAQDTVNEIREFEGNVVAHRCNVIDQKQVAQVIDVIAKITPVNILVNNAGISHIGNLEATSEADLDKLYEVNIKGIYNCMRACIKYMKANKEGVILNMASIASSVGLADRFAYSMTKGAVLTMTYSVAKDYIDYNIRCNSISPARIHTPFVDGFLKNNYPGKEKEMFDKLAKTQPIGRMGRPDEVAELALFLCSKKAAFITGTDYPIDGGFIKLNG